MINSKQFVGFAARAAAILTTSPVATAVLNVPATLDGWVQVNVAFTLWSLTNVIIKPQILGPDGNWEDVTDPGSLTLTADGNKAFAVCCKGAKQFRCTATGTGTVTSSSLALWFGYQTAGGVSG
jgi:hypothetical protein